MPRSSREKTTRPKKAKKSGAPRAKKDREQGKRKTTGGPGDRLSFREMKAPSPGQTLLDLQISSDLSLKYAYVLRAMESLRTGLSLSQEAQDRCERCLNEAITNAMVWGNGGDTKKKVSVRLWEDEGRWGFTISDEGSGFKADVLPDYESEEFLWAESGRGIFLLLNDMSEVTYYDGGRTLLVVS